LNRYCEEAEPTRQSSLRNSQSQRNHLDYFAALAKTNTVIARNVATWQSRTSFYPNTGSPRLGLSWACRRAHNDSLGE